MSEAEKGQNEPGGERIIVAVKDVGEETLGQASFIDDRVRAKRIVESLVKHGVEPEAVSALKAREMPFKVSYQWVVELEDKGHNGRRLRIGRLFAPLFGLLRTIAPERPFELRIDRLIWVGLWVTSLFVLGVSLVASMSNGAAREVVIEIPAQFKGSSESQAPVGSPPAASPLNREAGSDQTSPAVGGVSRLPECVEGGIDDCQCADFKTQAEAQQFYEAHPPGPGHIVDPDGNGLMCEWLPKA